jgi:hypothetical protein
MHVLSQAAASGPEIDLTACTSDKLIILVQSSMSIPGRGKIGHFRGRILPETVQGFGAQQVRF